MQLGICLPAPPNLGPKARVSEPCNLRGLHSSGSRGVSAPGRLFSVAGALAKADASWFAFPQRVYVYVGVLAPTPHGLITQTSDRLGTINFASGAHAANIPKHSKGPVTKAELFSGHRGGISFNVAGSEPIEMD